MTKPRNTLLAVLALFPVLLERLMRPRIKALVYRRLYGGAWSLWDALAVRLYKHLPDRHPIVLLTQEGR